MSKFLETKKKNEATLLTLNSHHHFVYLNGHQTSDTSCWKEASCTTVPWKAGSKKIGFHGEIGVSIGTVMVMPSSLSKNMIQYASVPQAATNSHM